MTDSQAEPAKQYSEHTFFHTYDQKPIYLAEYIPDHAVNRQQGVVLCKPIWGERIRTHRVYTNFARRMAAEGFHVITCDYYGDGNSAGDALDLSIPGMVDDIVQMNSYLNERFGLIKTALVGMLIGANAACLAGERIRNLGKIIMIQPVMNPIEHLETALRSNLSTQMVVHKKVIKDRNTLINEIKDGIPVNVDGFLLGKRLWESYETISPLKDQKSGFTGEAVIISLKKKASKGTDYTLVQKNLREAKVIEIEQEFVWTDWKVYKPKPPLLFQTLRAEIECTIAN